MPLVEGIARSCGNPQCTNILPCDGRGRLYCSPGCSRRMTKNKFFNPTPALLPAVYEFDQRPHPPGAFVRSSLNRT